MREIWLTAVYAPAILGFKNEDANVLTVVPAEAAG